MKLATFLLMCSLAVSAQTFSVIHSFSGPDGRNLRAGLVLDSTGNLYGTSWLGGAHNEGDIFRLDTQGDFTALYSFAQVGASPEDGVVHDSAGNLYGTTSRGGYRNSGIVFKLDTAGNITPLHRFKRGMDGLAPSGGLVRDAGGNLYGTTTAGGGTGCGGAGCGIVFKIDTANQYSVLHRFKGKDGANPQAALIIDGVGNLYGTTELGGKGNGTVFKLDTNRKLTVLHRFSGPDGGQTPTASLVRDASGNLYGSAPPVVFKVDANGKESVLHTFKGAPDGEYPNGLMIDEAGNLYGTTYNGGTGTCVPLGCGTIFKIDAGGVETVLYNFGGGTDGANPMAALAQDQNGNLYGTTRLGGASGCGNYGTCGVVFKLTP